MSLKSRSNAIYNSTDMVSGGLLTTIKNTVVNTYEGYFEDKFNDLMDDLLKNKITEEEVLKFINNLGSIDKDIYFSIVNKNLLSETKIKRFLLSKILFFKVKNTKLDYFHSTLLSSIELFTEIDFQIIYNINLNSQNEENKIIFSIENIDKSYLSTKQKLTSIGFINGGVFDGGGFDDTIDNFYVFNYYFELENLLEEFFTQSSNP